MPRKRDDIPASISHLAPATGPTGQLAHPAAIEHLQRLERRLYKVGEHAWCLVGNGLSNQTFIEGPEGIIAIDTGESVEEMSSALRTLREHTQRPIVACIYTHFHYVNGTEAILQEPGNRDLQIYAHAGIEDNLRRFGGEVAPRSNRGLVHQFGTMLPKQGADALLHCGLGQFLRNPDHAPFTPGYLPAQHQLTTTTQATIAGLQVTLTPAPSDASDSITIWFETLQLCVNNLIWPSLFNIFAIRGEEYRDPRRLLDGIDHIAALAPQHLLCTHGPPLSGTDISDAVIDYRDSIQFIWDQTVRGTNQGLTLDELTTRVQLPEHFQRSYFTQQFYGLVEHHVRQIHSGLFGWFDEDESHLFPLPTAERCRRLIKGFGGRVKVRQQARAALTTADYRWGLELATWLVRSKGCTPRDRQLLADLLRATAQHTTSANLRNWCLTRALELEGKINLQRHRQHRFNPTQVLSAPPERFIDTLRVLLDPTLAAGLDAELAWHFMGGARTGLRVRNHVAITTSGADADMTITLSQETWAALLANTTTMSQCLELGTVSLAGDPEELMTFLKVFDVDGFR
ncbi:MAG: alkyl sulfatase dimerization domain-containing protein [Pseudomonadota bacterium]